MVAQEQGGRSGIARAAQSKDRPDKPVEVRSDRVPGLLLRVQPSGARSFYVQVARGKRVRLGSAAVLTLKQAEERARAVLLDPEGTAPALSRKVRGAAGVTLQEYLDDEYAPFVRARRKSAEDTIDRIKAAFPTLLGTRLTDLRASDIDRLRTKRLASGLKAATVNRDTAALSGLLAHWCKNTKGAVHPLRDLEALDQPDDKRVRFLAPEEEARLRQALAQRDAEGIAARLRFNVWCRARGQAGLPEIAGPYCDHVTPLTLLSLNTGLRRGEAFGLTWAAVNMEKKQITVRASTSKSDKARVIPLNAEALQVLQAVRPPIAKGLVFASPVTGERLTNIKKAWAGLVEAAKLEDFRWHDLRHTFASHLVQRGVSLFAVQQLLGHGSSVMTQRYAHLAPDHLADAVAVLDKVAATGA